MGGLEFIHIKIFLFSVIQFYMQFQVQLDKLGQIKLNV